MTKAKRVVELAVLLDLKNGIQSFRVEYNRWPIPHGTTTTADLEVEVSGLLLSCLLGEKVCGNDQGIRFIEPPSAKTGKRGLVASKEGYHLVDSWGHPYRVIIDLAFDGKIDNPDLKNANTEIRAASPNQQLPMGVAAMGAGPDGVFFTRDDFVSWRNSPSIPPTIGEVIMQPAYVLALVSFALLAYSAVGLIVTRGRKGL